MTPQQRLGPVGPTTLVGTKATTAKTHTNLSQKPAWHSDRQSLNPPTAWPHAHTNSPPDEDSLPKRVADSERYHKHINLTKQGLCPPTNNCKPTMITA